MQHLGPKIRTTMLIFSFWFLLALTTQAKIWMTEDEKIAIDEASTEPAYIAKKIKEMFDLAENAEYKDKTVLKNAKSHYEKFFQEKEQARDLIFFALLISTAMTPQEYKKHELTNLIMALRSGFEISIPEELADFASKKLFNPIEPEAILTNFFIPVFFMGPMANFSIQAYLYALKKGILLFGLPNAPSADVHGGLYSTPAEICFHDFLHAHDIIKIDLQLNILNKIAADNLKKAAGFLLDIIMAPDGPFVTTTEKERALQAAYLLTHESYIRPINNLKAPFLTGKNYTAKQVIKRLKFNLFERLNMEFLRDDLFNKSTFNNATRSFEDQMKFSSEFAKAMASLFPEQEDKIFTDDNHNIHYNVKLVRNLLFQFVNSFLDKINGHIGRNDSLFYLIYKTSKNNEIQDESPVIVTIMF